MPHVIGNGVLAVFPMLARPRWLPPGLAGSMAAYGLAYLGVAASNWFALTVVLVLLAHFAGGTNWVMSNYALQLVVPDRLRGRVFATDMTLAIAVSLLVVGVFIDTVDLRVLVAACGVTTLVYAVGWRLAAGGWRPGPAPGAASMAA